MDSPEWRKRARDLWNEAADPWEEFVEAGLDYYRTEVHGPALLSVCGSVKGRRIIDVGCGQGWFSRELASRGGLVTGVDWAERLVEHARRHEETDRLGVEYLVLDAAEIGACLPHGRFGLATACFSLQDMPEPLGVLRAVRLVLTTTGRLAFSVPHPATDTRYREWDRDDEGSEVGRPLKIDGYFETGPRVLRWTMGRLRHHFETVQWRRTLSDWCSLVAEAGYTICRILEPRPTTEQARARPALDGCRRLPHFLVFDLVKDAAAPKADESLPAPPKAGRE